MIYLDHAATTPVDPAVREAMLPFLDERWGNPSSAHRTGQEVRRALDAARDAAAAALGAESGEIVFTSGGTEADNAAILGTLLAARERGRDEVIVTASEHHAVLDCAQWAADALGLRATVLPVDRDGLLAPEVLAEAVTERTALVSVMHANNEVGTIQPIAPLSAVAHERGALFHTDAVQSAPYLPLSVDALGVDLLTLSGHKLYGPKGSGLLYVRRGTPFEPWLHGGSQEREKRPGTENPAGIVGLGVALALLPTWRDEAAVRGGVLRDAFWEQLQAAVPGIALNGPPLGPTRLSNNLNVRFPSTEGETLLVTLDLAGICASAGSACASGSVTPSHVLIAIGLTSREAQRSVRFSLGRSTTAEQLEETVAQIVRVVRR